MRHREPDTFKVGIHDFQERSSSSRLDSHGKISSYGAILRVAERVAGWDPALPGAPYERDRAIVVILRRRRDVTDNDILALYEEYRLNHN